MENSMQMNLNTSKLGMVSTASKFKSRAYKVQVISCRGRADGNTDFYRVLRLDRTENVGLDEIKKAYRGLVLEYHPDVCPPSSKDEYTKRFLELQMAYETLSDPISRKMYDYELRSGNGWMDERGSKFPRDVWEKQLDGLKKRSHARLMRMNNMYR
ncbi:hypothetical protein V6N13_126800 [Hibiscus sabdariffa]|uniref:J domain-containing protein n=1 Tax=Hibiscus sabdariffa TaxID=183260 RepID=A0ABR2REV7_9ROSI